MNIFVPCSVLYMLTTTECVRLVSFTTKTASAKLLVCFASTRTLEDRLGAIPQHALLHFDTLLIVQHV